MKRELRLLGFIIFYTLSNVVTAQNIDRLIKKQQLMEYFHHFYTVEELEKLKLQSKKEAGSNPIAKHNMNFEVLATTNYIWRDVVYNYPAIQPSTNYTFGDSGLSLNLFSSFGVNYDTNDLEISPTLRYNYPISKHINISLGGAYYYAPTIEGIENSNFGEAFATMVCPTTLLRPNVSVFVSDSGAFYTALALEKELYSWKNNGISVTGSLGHRCNDIKETTGLRHLNLGASASFESTYTAINIFLSATQLIQQNTIHVQTGVNFMLK